MTRNWSLSFRYWTLSILTILSVGLVWLARDLVTPLIFGALLAFVMNPMIGFITHRTRISRSWAATIVLITGLGLLITLAALMIPRLIAEIQILVIDLQKILSQANEKLSQPVIFLDWEFHFEHLIPDLTKLLSERISTIPQNAFHLLEVTSKSLIWALVIMATVFYLLRDWTHLRDWIFKVNPFVISSRCTSHLP